MGGGKTITIRLSYREAEILSLMAEGLTNKEIARRKCVSPETVKTYVANLLKKLGARNRVEAAIVAVRAGFLSTAFAPRIVLQSQEFALISSDGHYAANADVMDPPPPRHPAEMPSTR